LIDSIAGERTRTIGRPDAAPKLDRDGWRGFVDRIRNAARIATDEFGLVASIHAHAGGYCDFENELDSLLNEIDDAILKVCIDTAHCSLAGMDPLTLTERYASRISHIHLKDLDPVKKAQVLRDGTDFYEACADNLFCQFGEGQIDFSAFLTASAMWAGARLNRTARPTRQSAKKPWRVQTKAISALSGFENGPTPTHPYHRLYRKPW
jgi:inosose dehydratase